MFDPITFFSVYLAFVASFASMEAISFLLHLLFSSRRKKQEADETAQMEELFAKAIKEGKMPPMGTFPREMFPPGFPFPEENVTCSGNSEEKPGSTETIGQYL